MAHFCAAATGPPDRLAWSIIPPPLTLGPDHAGRYLASFAWRYNRRYQLQTMIPRFVHSAARTQPMPYRLLIAG